MTENSKTSVFDALDLIDVNMYKETRNGFNYLSWSDAWSIVKRKFPNTTYSVLTFGENELPYQYDPATGYMVGTTVTINGITHSMWLPVLDSANHALKAEPYEIQTKYKTIRVEACTMFDVNKAIMRCLVKNLAMHGLGMYLYRGEDLPENAEPAGSTDEQPWDAPQEALKPLDAKQIKKIGEIMTSVWGDHPARHAVFRYLTGYDVRNIATIPSSKYNDIVTQISLTQEQADRVLREVGRLGREQ